MDGNTHTFSLKIHHPDILRLFFLETFKNKTRSAFIQRRKKLIFQMERNWNYLKNRFSSIHISIQSIVNSFSTSLQNHANHD